MDNIDISQMKQIGGGSGDDEKRRQMQEQAEKAEEMRASFLANFLDQEARARLNTIAMVKPEKAKELEGMIVSMARGGRLAGKLTEKQLVSMLEQIDAGSKKSSSGVKFERRAFDDDDDDILGELEDDLKAGKDSDSDFD
eukprot:Clim_evm14s156 gene=Clim_evmTU14s156